MKNVYIITSFFVVILLAGCISSTIKNKERDVLEKIKLINVDSVSDFTVFRREKSLFVTRYIVNDTCGFVQILCKKGELGDILFKYQQRWINLDSLCFVYASHRNSCINGKIRYCISIFDELDLLEINSSCKTNGIRVITIDSSVFYYSEDEYMIKDFEKDSTLIKLENNWWSVKK